MYGLTVNRIISLSGHPSIINKITLVYRNIVLHLDFKLIKIRKTC